MMINDSPIFQIIRKFWKTYWKVILFFCGCYLIWFVFVKLTDQPKYTIFTRELGVSTENLVEVFNYPKLRVNDFPIPAANENGVIFTSDGKELMAFDPISGTFIWRTNREHRDRFLLYSDNMLFCVSTRAVDAYDATTGYPQWHQDLGHGGVRIRPQIDDNILRIYYGEVIFELDPATGVIIAQKDKSDIEWIQGDIEIRRFTPEQIVGIDRNTKGEVWRTKIGNFVTSLTSTRQIRPDQLRLLDTNANVCILNVETGSKVWCQFIGHISNFAITPDYNFAYVLLRNFVLWKVNLQTGEIEEETHFSPETPVSDSMPFFDSFVTVTEDGAIIILFGDSLQLLGLSVGS